MKLITSIVFGMMLLFGLSTSHAQTMYVKIPDIDGESTETSHKQWIEVLSFGQGLEQGQSSTGAARQRSSVKLNDLTIIKNLDKATPKLMQVCANGGTIRQMEFHMLNNGKMKYKLTLNNVKISSINTKTICDPDCKVVDEVTFKYSQITWFYIDNVGMETTATYNAQTGN